MQTLAGQNANSYRVRDRRRGPLRSDVPGDLPAGSPDELRPLGLGENRHAERLGLGELGAGTGAGNNVIRVPRYRICRFGAQAFGQVLRSLTRHPLEGASEHHRPSGDWATHIREPGIGNVDACGQPLDKAAVVRLAEVFGKAIGDGITNLTEGIHPAVRCSVVCGELRASLVKGLPGPIATGEETSRGLTHVRDAERVDETFQRDGAARSDRVEQLAYRHRSMALPFLEPNLVVARFESEDVGRFLDPALREEEFDLLVPESVDVEGAARCQVLQVFDRLIGTGKRPGATGDRPFPPKAVVSRTTAVRR